MCVTDIVSFNETITWNGHYFSVEKTKFHWVEELISGEPGPRVPVED